ncbi:RHS repeat-associated core domain-containing protein [Ruminiclostridium cellobioparum]|uniref:RHS repeat-associated core domain-containing protein n=1 Tax=Ruminiclostridium cellobioparum subsp. termitidis CT1112 TaxID=1195236 RepID=S0FJE8_RUMCE|nr:RHS repeat-associated core domain-containing protein [Ruminiclostridium cellobioparum]EMS69249.1 RHS repeat-associated core domain-containing protein [Ruminiclostridium cellobioparum subsp. termitidis CT1112]
MKNIQNHLIKIFILLVIFITLMPFKSANAETLEEQLNNLVGPKQQYSTMLSPAYLRNNENEVSVDPQSGSLTLKQTDYVLPGRNGLDLKVERIYKNDTSNVHEMRAYYSGGALVDYIYSDVTTSSFYENRYNLGVGWRFSFPTIENRQNSDGSSFKYLHTESGDIYRLVGPTVVEGINTYTLENHTVKDLDVKEDASYNNGQYQSKYVMIEKNGNKTYFDSDGRILSIIDRYSNTIKFEYSAISYTIDGYTRVRTVITKITDTVGRIVNIQYKEDPNFTVIKNPDGSISGDLQGKFQVIIYLPDSTPNDLTDNKKIIYDKSGLLYSSTSLHNIRERIQRVYDTDGNLKYHYWFDQPDLGFTYNNGSSYSVTNRYDILNQIDYCKSNKLTRFVYGTYTKQLSSWGSMQYRKITQMQDLSKTGFDDTKTNYWDKYICDIKDKTTYSYTNEPDGYGYSGYNGYDDNYLKNTYRYYSEVTDMRGAKNKYTYDGLGETINVESRGNDHKIVSTTTYDTNKLPQRNESLEYNVVNGQASGTPVKKVEDYVYDPFGNLTQYSGPSYRDSNGKLTGNTYTTPEGTTVNEHTVVYTYATDQYHALTSKTWKKDAITTSRIAYTVDLNGNITQEKKVHTENGTDKSILTDYLYDSYGNMTQSKCHYSDNTNNTYTENYEYAVDADGVDQKGAYLTKQYSIVDGKDISTKYTYDFYTGNKMADIDAKGNSTGYSYDVLERLIQIKYPDNTTKSYQYIDNYYSNSAVWFIDQLNYYFRYTYDIFGNLVEYENLNTAGTKLQFQYDSNGNKIKEIDALGHSTRYEYDSANRLTKKSFWENDTAQKSFMTLAYTTGYDSNTPLLLNVIDEEGYIRKYYYDILNRLVKEDATPDKSNYYSKVYSYDYSGNETSIKDARNNTINYTYDDLNRRIKQADALFNSTSYSYDAEDKLIMQSNALGVSTYWEYDGLGRLVREKAPATDGTVAVTRYVYDENGNKVKVISPKYYESAKDTPELVTSMTGISYTYDIMDRLQSTLSPEGNVLEYRKYDSNGNVRKVVDGLRYNGNIDTSSGSTYYYDTFNRVTQETNAAGGNTYYVYDAVGNLIKKTDAKGYITIYSYNPDRTISKITYPDTGAVEYTYDKIGNMLTTKDQRGNTTNYTYNGFKKILTIKDPYNYTIENGYDENGNLKSVKDKKGSYSYFEYDADNRLKQKRVPLELNGSNIIYSIENYDYDVVGNIKTKTTTGTEDATSSRIFNYTYYNNNLLNAVIDNAGRSETYYYDKNSNKIKTVTLRSGGLYDICKYEYDNRDRLIKSINLMDETSIFNTANITNISVIRDSEYTGKIQLITGYEYDLLGNKTKVIDPRAYGYLVSDTINRDKYATRYTYDALNRLEKVYKKYNGADVYTQYYYDANGNKTAERNERGNYTYFTYDTMNRLKTVKDALSNTLMYGYDLCSNKITVTNASNNTFTYGYDKLNRLETITGPDNVIITKNIYDANGNVIKKIDAKGYLSGSDDTARYGTVYTYDRANRLVMVIDPEIKALNDSTKYSFKYEYNKYNQKTIEINALGQVTYYKYSTAGNLQKVTDALGISTEYTYDNIGNMLSMKDGRGKITNYNYGAFGVLLSNTNAENRTISYKYDLALNKTQMLDRNGNETLFSYDSRNLILSRSVTQTGDSVSYSYNEVGSISSMTDTSGTSTYGYDTVDRVLQINKNGVFQLGYTYDALGNILTVKDKKGFVTTYTYDKSNRMKTVSYTILGTAKTTAYNYDVNGNRQSVMYAGGVTEEYTYDKNNRLKTLINKRPEGSAISSYTYTYDMAGNQKSKTDSYGTTNYTYDSDGRILEVQMPGKTTVYAYDAVGNRISLNETYTSDQGSGYTDQASGSELKYSAKHSEYVYSDSNTLLKIIEYMKDSSGNVVLQKSINYWYDYNGNQIYQSSEFESAANTSLAEDFDVTVSGAATAESAADNIETGAYSYDGFNRLVKVDTIKGSARTITEFIYDGTDLRVKKTVKKSTSGYRPEVTNYQYDRQYVILETDDSNNVKARYIRGINYIARIDPANKQSYFLFNGHGDVVHTVSEAGVVENNYEYDIFGTPTLTIEQYPCAIRYAGEFYDSETGLYYLRARYYDCYIARFISEDTYRGKANDPLSLNLYTYCHNEPVMYIDPTGHTDAYLTDLAKASKGTVVWDSKNKVAVVTVNGVKKELKVSDYKNLNGKIVIDNNQFDAMFTKTYKDTSYKSTIDTTVKNGQITATQYVKDSKVTVQTKTLSSITSTYIPTYNLSGNANQGAGNAKISKPDNIKQSGGAIAPTMAPPKAIPIPNPFLLAAEIIVINLFTPTVVSGGDLTPEQVLQDKLIEKARVDALTITEETNPDRGTTIYRYTNKYDRQSLTPAPADAIVVRKGIPQAKGVDDFTLSFSTNPGAGWVTTVEAVNSTGYLIAIQDTTNHVSIIPNPEVESIYGTMKDWRDSYNNANTEPHFYTKILNAISTRIK